MKLFVLLALSVCVSQAAFTCDSIKLSTQQWPRTDGVILTSDVEINPAGTIVVYLADNGADSNAVKQMYSVDIDGGTPTRINTPLAEAVSTVRDFRISPDGSRVVYSADAATAGEFELYSVPIAGGASVKLNPERDTGTIGSKFDYRFVPSDGSKVVFKGNFKQDNGGINVQELYSAGITGTPAAVRISSQVDTTGRDVMTWSFSSVPSAKVIFTGDLDIDGDIEIFATDIAASNVVKLNEEKAGATFAIQYWLCDDRVLFNGQFDAAHAQIRLYSASPVGAANNAVPISKDSTTGGFIAPPICSVPAGRVVYYGDLEAVGQHDVYSTPKATETFILLSPQRAGAQVNAVYWSRGLTPDGNRFLWIADHTTANMDLFSVAVAGTTVPAEKINDDATIGNGEVLDFKIGPDSGSVVFRSQQNANLPWLYYAGTTPSVTANSVLNPAKTTGVGIDSDIKYRYFDANTVVFIGAFAAQSVADELYVSRNVAEGVRLSGDSEDPLKVVTSFTFAGSYVVYSGDLDTIGVPELYSSLVATGTDNKLKLNTPIGFGFSIAQQRILTDNSRVLYYETQNGLNTLFSATIDAFGPLQVSKTPVGGGSVTGFQLSPNEEKLVYTGLIDVDTIADLFRGCPKVVAPTAPPTTPPTAAPGVPTAPPTVATTASPTRVGETLSPTTGAPTAAPPTSASSTLKVASFLVAVVMMVAL